MGANFQAQKGWDANGDGLVTTDEMITMMLQTSMVDPCGVMVLGFWNSAVVASLRDPAGYRPYLFPYSPAPAAVGNAVQNSYQVGNDVGWGWGPGGR